MPLVTHTMTDAEVARWKINLTRFKPRVYHPPREPRYALGALRRAVFNRDAGQCQYCGRVLTWEGAVFDHVVPWPAGKTEIGNLVVACPQCNKLKMRQTIPTKLRPLA